MISKEQFVTIMDQLKAIYDFKQTINNEARKLKYTLDSSFTDFFDSNSLIVNYENIVIELLENMFKADTLLDYWVYDLEYGTIYEKGCITDCNGKEIDISSAEKLYDYLVKEMVDNYGN